ncbi:MAG: acyltransferase family protein [Bacteroidales bacterium]|nr:acyltransferase family protein [Bacteroidales bacterium]
MRDKTFTLLKGLGILLVVLAHASAPIYLGRFAYMINVPVFFIFAGYMFKTSYLQDKTAFVVSRFRRLYFPFVRWSILFLLLHNLLFPLGLLSEQYGNAAGGVTHPYSWAQAAQHLWSIVFNMSGYDPFLAGAFWFFRALLLSSLSFLALFYLSTRFQRLRGSMLQVGTIIVLMLALATWLAIDQLKITGVAQGGYRELMGVAFMGIGFLLRHDETQNPSTPIAKPLFGLGAGIVVLTPLVIWLPVSMSTRPAGIGSVYALFVAGTAGFLLLRALSHYLQLLPDKVLRPLLYLGDNTLYVFAFHLLAFKLVSALKVGVYGLPWGMVGGHPVVQHAKDDFFWMLYTLVGTAVPLLWIWAWRRLCERHNFKTETPSDWLRIVVRLSIMLYQLFVRMLIAMGRGIVAFGKGTLQTIKDILAASNPKEEE